jgi:hypothetical protein
MLAVLDEPPEDVLRHLDVLAQGTDEVQLATCVYAVYDPVGRTLVFATAGHPPPVLRAPDGSTALLPQPSGAPLGVGGVPFESVTVPVADGSRLLLYTDGLVESRDTDIDETIAGLSAAFRDGTPDLDLVCDHLLSATSRDAGHDDDVALLVAELSGLDPHRVDSWVLGDGLETVKHARSWARNRLEDWQLAPLVEVAELLVSELLTNAIRHGTGRIEVSLLLLDEIVTIAVTDDESHLPRPRRVAADDEGGRGLLLVSALAGRWGARPTASGKVVWCDLPRARP